MTTNIFTFSLLLFCTFICFTLLYLISKKIKKSQLQKSFIWLILNMLICLIGLNLQCILGNRLNIPLIYYDYFVYIGTCLMPVAFYNFSKIFSNTRYKLNKWLLVIPILSLILLWTNDFHHLFYIKYSIIPDKTIYGKYFSIHTIYTLLLYIISLFNLVKYSIRNSGIFSSQAILMLISCLIPITINLLIGFGVISSSIYITPITFSLTLLLITLAIFKFDFLKVTPIALQRIVDRISDSYAILNKDYEITDFNETFIKTFKIKVASNLRGKHFAKFLKDIGLENKIKEFGKYIEKIDKSKKIKTFELEIPKINKFFNVEITSIMVNGQFLGILVLFKDITQHIHDMKSLKNNQELLIEQERLASLGQMIGGIAHNLKTPIFSVSGGLEGLSDLVKEFDESIEDTNVTNQDMHDIAKDMNEWITKLKEYITYMSDIITTVKGQAVNMSEAQKVDFPISELFQHINILMQHILKEQLATLEIKNNVPDNITINGNINSLVQVINNLILNSIESYGETEKIKKVELCAKRMNNNIIISVKDFGLGISDDVKDKLFKEMITTKGKNGTGLGLFMSYSNIKAHFNGTITFESTKNQGTTFNIIIPI